MQTQTIESLVNNFVGQLDDAIMARAQEMAREAVEAALSGKGTARVTKTGKPRKKGPIQLCPVPKCTNRAAPVYGMVCAEHKSTPKKLIAKYREARRAKAAKGKN